MSPRRRRKYLPMVLAKPQPVECPCCMYQGLVPHGGVSVDLRSDANVVPTPLKVAAALCSDCVRAAFMGGGTHPHTVSRR